MPFFLDIRQMETKAESLYRIEIMRLRVAITKAIFQLEEMKLDEVKAITTSLDKALGSTPKKQPTNQITSNENKKKETDKDMASV